MTTVSVFDKALLQLICNVLGDTNSGLTGANIEQHLRACNVADISVSSTKRHRLFAALQERQINDKHGNQIVAFIQSVMNPVAYIPNRNLFEERRNELNRGLAFAGLTLGEDGKVSLVAAVHTLAEAEQRASRLKQELQSRHVHSDVLLFCQAELVQDNYFHAVFEVTKSVADKIRQRTRLTSDGSKLVDEAFELRATGMPILAFNSLQTETEKNEHRGLMNLLKGLFSTFRNTHAHAPKIHWNIKEQDAFDMLSFASLLHRRLDDAVLHRRLDDAVRTP